MHALITYLHHVRDEFQHIRWPSSHTALAHALVVIVIALLVAALVGLLDYGFGALVSSLVGA